MGGVVGGVRTVRDFVLDLPGYEDEATIFEQRSRVDQVLNFFEREYDRYEAFVPDASRLEAQRIEYYNCVNAVEFQNELLAQLVDELLEIRAALRTSTVAERKEMAIRLAHVKLDISDRKNKRRLKEKERLLLREALSPQIAEIKLARLLEEQECERRQAVDAKLHWAGGAPGEAEVCSTQREAHQTVAHSRKRYKHYSDDEIASLLREKDD